MDFASYIIMLAVFCFLGGVIYLITSFGWLKCNNSVWLADDPKKHAVFSIAALLCGFVVILAIFIFFPQSHEDATDTIYMTFRQLLFTIISLLPVVIVMLLLKEPSSSIGIKKNLIASLFIGVFLSMTFIFRVEVNNLFAIQSLETLPLYLIIGFGEEVLMRAYFQQRMIAWLGAAKGIVIAAIVMAAMHFPQYVLINESTMFEAVVAIAWIIPVSGLLGFVMWRTNNVVAPGLLHTTINWTS